MSDVNTATLAAVVDLMTNAYLAARIGAEQQLDAWYNGQYGMPSWVSEVHGRDATWRWNGQSITPDTLRDKSGRFVLLDALTALVQAQAVLTQTNSGQSWVLLNEH